MSVKSQGGPVRNWVQARLGELATLITKGSTPTTYGHAYTQSGISFIRVENLSDGYIDRSSVTAFIDEEADEKLKRSRLQAGDILVSIAGTIGRVALVRDQDVPANTNQALALVRGTNDVLTPSFLMYFLRSSTAYEQTLKNARGGAMSNISLADISHLDIPVPPLLEQHRIVAEVEKQFTRLDAAVAALRRAKANLKRYRASVLKAAYEGRLVPTEAELARREGRSFEPASELLKRILTERRARWEADQLAKFRASPKIPKDDKWKSKYKEPNEPDTASLSELPEGWAWATTGQVCEIQGGIQKQPSRRPIKNVFPFLRVANVFRGRLDLSEVHRIEVFPGELDKLCLKPRDLLIVEGNGSPTEIGRMAIWKGEIENCVHQNHIIRARPVPGITPQLISLFWNSPDGMAAVLSVAGSTSGLYTLSVSKVSKLTVPLPPLPEQERIVAEVDRCFSVIEGLEAVVEANLKRAHRLRQAILKHAFEGKLVPQDPDEEPASVLLERIKAVRSTDNAVRSE